MNRNLWVATALALAIFGPVTPTAVEGQEPTRSITHISGDLYRAQNNNHFNILLVTPEGIIMTDPINRDFSTWLQGEIDRRWGVPVRYVLYTHHHWDHASGGDVFGGTAQFIGHETMPGYMALPAGDPPLPVLMRGMDTNRNGRIERAEATGALLAQFDATDMNGDGALSGAEVLRGPLNEVRAPDITFTDRHTVTLGGQTMEIVNVGVAHARDISVMLVPSERVMFGVDIIQVKRLPTSLDPTMGDWIDTFRAVTALDYDTVVPGHGVVGTKADMTNYLRYLEELAAAVGEGVGRGLTHEQIYSGLDFEAYSHWERFPEAVPLHVEQTYRMLNGTP